MTYKELIYMNAPIPAKSEDTVRAEMKWYYKKKDYHLVAYFNYTPEGLNKDFPLCVAETYESIYWRYRNFKPIEGRKCEILDDKDCLIFPIYSIVDCSDMPKLYHPKKVFMIFVEEQAKRFIIFVNYQKKNAFPECGGYGHVLYSSKSRD